MTLLLLIGSVLAAIVPMFTFLAVVWWLDRYDREPVWLLTITFFWGAIPAVLIALPGSAVLGQVLLVLSDASGLDPALAASVTGPVLVAPLIEEPAKALILIYLIFNRHFDNMTDGFVYGAAAGLGFGMTENVIYFLAATDNAMAWGATVVVRTFYSAVMHATATSIIGAALGFGRFRGPWALLASGVVGYGLALGVHALWNGLIVSAEAMEEPGLFVANLALFPIEALLVFLVFQVCLFTESRTIARELAEEAAMGTLPATHPPRLASWWSRMSRRWMPHGVDHDTYVRLATRLALRRNQVRLLGPRATKYYHDDVARLRAAVREVLRHST
ncbi:MAG: PrsW family intramembrane metalloprotease [Myxococcota bacterium]